MKKALPAAQHAAGSSGRRSAWDGDSGDECFEHRSILSRRKRFSPEGLDVKRNGGVRIGERRLVSIALTESFSKRGLITKDGDLCFGTKTSFWAQTWLPGSTLRKAICLVLIPYCVRQNGEEVAKGCSSFKA